MMIATQHLPIMVSVGMNVILADAVVLSWDDLMPQTDSGLIHIEYHVEPLGSVEYMKIWASTVRGYWKLVCEHWMRSHPNHAGGLRFDNDYKSDQLSEMLDMIMEHQEILFVGVAPGKDPMVQVHPPNGADKAVANSMMNVFRQRIAN